MNNNEVKFKLWSDKLGKTIVLAQIDLIHNKCFGYIDPNVYDIYEFDLKDSDNKLLRYSGYKDSDGIELFDGDIVRWVQNIDGDKIDYMIAIKYDDDINAWLLSNLSLSNVGDIPLMFVQKTITKDMTKIGTINELDNFTNKEKWQ